MYPICEKLKCFARRKASGFPKNFPLFGVLMDKIRDGPRHVRLDWTNGSWDFLIVKMSTCLPWAQLPIKLGHPCKLVHVENCKIYRFSFTRTLNGVWRKLSFLHRPRYLACLSSQKSTLQYTPITVGWLKQSRECSMEVIRETNVFLTRQGNACVQVLPLHRLDTSISLQKTWQILWHNDESSDINFNLPSNCRLGISLAIVHSSMGKTTCRGTCDTCICDLHQFA